MTPSEPRQNQRLNGAATRRHPVADNPLRILHSPEWRTLDDLRRVAKVQKLMTRKSPVAAREPFPDIAQRVRTEEDYLAAEAAISSPESLALALAFSISGDIANLDVWSGENKSIWGLANSHLLFAEGASQGRASKADYLNTALRIFDDADLRGHIQNACAKASQLTGTPVNTERILQKFQQEVLLVIEKAISNFGNEIDTEEVELLETLDSARTFPEVAGLEAAIKRAIDKQTNNLLVYYKQTDGIVEAYNKGVKLAAHAAESLFTQASQLAVEFARSFQLIDNSHLLARRFDKAVVTAVTNRLALSAWYFGYENDMWDIAAKCVNGLQVKYVEHDDTLTCDLWSAVIRLAPIMAHGEKHEKIDALDSISRIYPLLEGIMLSLQQKLDDNVCKPLNNASSNSNVSWGCLILFIIGVIGMFILISSHQTESEHNKSYDGSTQSSSPYTAPVTIPSTAPRNVPVTPKASTPSPRMRMKASLDSQLLLIRQMESSLDSKKSNMDLKRTFMVTNAQIDNFNSLVDDYNRSLSSYKIMLQEYNNCVDRYNAGLYDR